MSKPNFQYVWDNVDNILHRIESIIDFHSHTKYLYNMKYFSIEDDDFLHKYVNYIKFILIMKKQFGVGYVFKLHCY